jgi:exodeoxyribonuclease-5
MNASFLESYMLHVSEVCLRDVVRQDSMSGILLNATNIRNFIDDGDTFSLPSLRLKGHGDVCSVPGNELIEELASAYSRAGVDDTIVVTRSNKRANIYNRGIRAQILGREEELESGDMLMVAKNNYFWTERECDENGRKVSPVDFIANGDILRVERVRNFRELYGFRFATCTLSMPDYDDYEMEMDVILDTLHTETPSLSQTELDKLSERVLEDYPELTNKKDKMKMLKENNYFNALQIKYAYAVTCHKAQGGQWSRVFVDQGYVTDEMMGADYYRWLYTAITRASEKLYLVNWPENQVQDE